MQPPNPTLDSPPPLLGYAAFHSATITPSTNPHPTALSTSNTSNLLAFAHTSGLISTYSPSLAHLHTLRTHLDQISVLRLLSPPHLAAISSSSFDCPALHLYHLLPSSDSPHLGSVRWFDPSDPRIYKSRVTSVAPADSHIFAAFEAPHRENCILQIDHSTLQVVAEIGRQSGSAMKTAAATKLVNVGEKGLVFALAVSGGAFGYSGYMRLWDTRSGVVVWETVEPGGMMDKSTRFGDSFADADVEREEGAVYKVCSKSGDVAVAELRMLGKQPWVYLEGRSGSGTNSLLHCYKKQVFVGKETGLEVWSQIEVDNDKAGAIAAPYRWRRNFVDKEEDSRRGAIAMMDAGGDRLFVSRIGMEGIEVWESSDLSRAISLL